MAVLRRNREFKVSDAEGADIRNRFRRPFRDDDVDEADEFNPMVIAWGNVTPQPKPEPKKRQRRRAA